MPGRYLVGAERERARRLAMDMNELAVGVDQMAEALGCSVRVVKRLLAEGGARVASSPEGRRPPRAGARFRAVVVDRYRDGWSITRICARYGCWAAQVREWVTDAGVPLRAGESTAQDRARWRARAVDAYRRHGTVAAVARETGLSASTVAGLLDQAGARPLPPRALARPVGQGGPPRRNARWAVLALLAGHGDPVPLRVIAQESGIARPQGTVERLVRAGLVARAPVVAGRHHRGTLTSRPRVGFVLTDSGWAAYRSGDSTVPAGRPVLSETSRRDLARQVVRRYLDGESIRALADAYGRSYGWVHWILDGQGVARRPRGGVRRPHRKPDPGPM